MSNVIKIGNLTIDSFKVGAADCSIYLGTTKLYPQGEPPTNYRAKKTNLAGYVFQQDCNGNSAYTSSDAQQWETIMTSVTSFTEVIFGECITEIADRAFLGASNLSALTFSNTITSIGLASFYNCSSLKSLTIPNNIITIGQGAFGNCSGLTSIIVNATTPPTLGNQAFNNTNDCPIYVPCESLSLYQQSWANYASRLQCISTHEYVDLGLPSGTKWATMNVGASSETDYGNYYQYGKGADDYQVTSGQSDYSGTENPLAANADTATQAWGGSWHTPTQAQFEELTANTTYEWTTINGVNGGKFTAQNGNYVFFPAAGEYDWRGYLIYDGNICYYRSSSFYQATTSCTPRFENGSVLVSFGVEHKEGCSIRPVMDN